MKSAMKDRDDAVPNLEFQAASGSMILLWGHRGGAMEATAGCIILVLD
jgi:hypothetical protein